MKRVLLLAALVVPLVAGAQNSGGRFDLSIPSIMRGPELYGRAPSNPRYTPDGQWIYFNWLPPGSGWRETMKPYRAHALAGARPERVTEAHMDSVGPSLAGGSESADRARRVVS
ncbi:MAG TPA: hypothetical protein VF981_11255, partial [Gemmatimonadaceae bacterium]